MHYLCPITLLIIYLSAMSKQIQSWLFTSVRGSFSVDALNIALCIVDELQPYFRGVRLNYLLESEHFKGTGGIRMTIDARKVMPEGSKNYARVRAALLELMSKRYEWWSVDRECYFVTPLIYDAELRKYSGELSFSVPERVAHLILDLRKGYSAYQLSHALSLRHVGAVRMYMLIASARNPITYTITQLKSFFGVGDKYPLTADFIKRVIDPCRDVLDAAGGDSFTYERVKTGLKVTALTITPRHRVGQSREDLLNMCNARALVGDEIYNFLLMRFGFTSSELNAHKRLLYKLSKLPFAMDFLYSLFERFRRKNRGKGYVIAALKSEVEQRAALIKRVSKADKSEQS